MGTQSGRLMGIGVSVVKDTSSGYARIIRVYANSPAEDLGFEVGGFITSIGDTSVKNLADTAAIQSALLGEEGRVVFSSGKAAPRSFFFFERRAATTTIISVIRVSIARYS